LKTPYPPPHAVRSPMQVLALYHVVMVMLTIDMMYRPENSLERLFTVTFGGIGTGLLVYGSTVVVQLALQWQAGKFDTYRRVRAPSCVPCAERERVRTW
jgi:hypothetical protein